MMKSTLNIWSIRSLWFQDLTHLLSRLDSPTSGESEVAAVIGQVEAMRQRQREVTNEEMQVLIEQRDIALAKVSTIISYD